MLCVPLVADAFKVVYLVAFHQPVAGDDVLVAVVEVVEVDRARIRFSVSVTDRFGDVGRGFHERFRVRSERFMEKAAAKLAGN